MLLGNQKIQTHFKSLADKGNLSHAYLFYGPEGVGKKLFVLKLAEEISGNLNGNPDIKIINKGDEEIYISDIREFNSFIYLTPWGKHKVAIINNAHKLNQDASNALLKVLEEPPGKSITFLISHLPKLILPTVLSRCQTAKFAPLKEKEVFNFLVEKRGVKKDVALSVSKTASGSLGRALELAGDFKNFQKNVEMLNRLVRADFSERFQTARKISVSAEELRRIAKDWLIWSAAEISGPGSAKLAKNLLHLNNILTKPQFNHKLALEGFLVRL